MKDRFQQLVNRTERLMRDIDSCGSITNPDFRKAGQLQFIIDALKQEGVIARNDALEEAAKIAEAPYRIESENIAEDIRELKDQS